MKEQRKIGVLLLVFGVAALAAWFGITHSERDEESTPEQKEQEEQQDGIQDDMPPLSVDQAGASEHPLIRVTAPARGAEVESPITLEGEARGYWFFEATAPVVVTDWDGRILGEGYVTADGEWMTEDFVPFSGELTYTQEPEPYSASGTLIFQRSNPSGLPENDDAFEIPVVLVGE